MKGLRAGIHRSGFSLTILPDVEALVSTVFLSDQSVKSTRAGWLPARDGEDEARQEGQGAQGSTQVGAVRGFR